MKDEEGTEGRIQVVHGMRYSACEMIVAAEGRRGEGGIEDEERG